MLLIRGKPVYSKFRLLRLLEKLQNVLPSIASVYAVYVYFVELEQPLTAEEREMLHELLSATDEFDPGVEQQMVVVMPRRGTISAWSSKATDIAYNCGLEKITRLERGIIYQIQQTNSTTLTDSELQRIYPFLFDRMTEEIGSCLEDADILFTEANPGDLILIPVLEQGAEILRAANVAFGLALEEWDIAYLDKKCKELERNPSDAELMMYAQINSEHCRHKIFNSQWVIDGEKQTQTLFALIRATTAHSPAHVLSAYRDNAAVIKGVTAKRLFTVGSHNQYTFVEEHVPVVIKVETHNHPTAISPFPGAATGAGGEIRDEGATGRGAKPVAGLTGFAVSNLKIPDYIQPWEQDHGQPAQVASALDIMLEAPIGAASFNNEFGRPNLCGFFRTYEQLIQSTMESELRGYHKPIMIAGGFGHIREQHIQKLPLPENTQLMVLGGPAMKIGLGGGAASSLGVSEGREDLDYRAVQRGNPEMQRRAQEVINRCWALGDNNPILSIHDVGAGGLANAVPEILRENNSGGRIELRAIPNDDLSMSPMAIWCNEAQERYVLAVKESQLNVFYEIAERERCLYSQIGEVSAEQTIVVLDGYFDTVPVDLPLSALFPDHSSAMIDTTRFPAVESEFVWQTRQIEEVLPRILQCPSVASKSFLITIGDRTVGGLTVRDQMVGPWQIPVADAAVCASGFYADEGTAMAMGERPLIALLNHAASARVACGEALTNLFSADIANFSEITLSANWMADMKQCGEPAGLYDAVAALSALCCQMGLTIPVGKDSLSMRMSWREIGELKTVSVPLSLVISGFASVHNVNKSWTPQLKAVPGGSVLLFIDLACGHQRLGGSALTQVFQELGQATPDLEEPQLLEKCFLALQQLRRLNKVQAYHDRSDGGLLVTILEMMFAGHCGVSLDISGLGDSPIASLFNEELGFVIQIANEDIDEVKAILGEYGLAAVSHLIGELNDEDRIKINHNQDWIYNETRTHCQKLWTRLSYEIQRLRDNPKCAEQAYQQVDDKFDPGLSAVLTFDINDAFAAPYINAGVKPAVAILREQGVNGHVEMAAAFERAGFNAIDVHMSDIIENRISLGQFKGLVACGGFSYGDVLGAGRGWAKTIVFNQVATEIFYAFFHREDTFSLGICNGCQMLANLKTFIPGAELWPLFSINQSEQFESRLAMVEIPPSQSIFFKGMEGSRLPIVVAHREGRVKWPTHNRDSQLHANQMVVMQYIDNYGEVTTAYPANPNGSGDGITGITSKDGRVTIMMPHPERVFLTKQFSWHPSDWPEESPWLRLFKNARVWVG